MAGLGPIQKLLATATDSVKSGLTSITSSTNVDMSEINGDKNMMEMEGCEFEYTSAKQTDETTAKTKKDYRWDKNGKLKSVLTINENGQVVSKTKYDRSDSRRVKSITDYKYNDKGQCVEEQITYMDGRKNTIKYQYNKDGQVSRTESEDFESGQTIVNEFVYDEEGNVVQQKHIRGAGVTIYDYSNHNETKTTIVEHVDESGQVINRREEILRSRPTANNIAPNPYDN